MSHYVRTGGKAMMDGWMACMLKIVIVISH